jgi:LCP family protein required for cell wall assembly
MTRSYRISCPTPGPWGPASTYRLTPVNLPPIATSIGTLHLPSLAMSTSSRTSTNSKPLFAAFASAIVPGIGQFIAGDSRKGRILLLIDVAILAIMLFFFRDKVSFLTMWIKPSSLALMMVGNILILGYRVWAADDAYRTAKAKYADTNASPGAAIVIGAVALGAVLLLPHAVFGYYDIVQYDLITSVFGDNTSQAAETTTTQASPPVTDASGNTVATTPPASTTTTASTGQFEGDDRLNILLIGGDFGEGRSGVRTDTMITVSIDPTTGETAMFSVPRNWTYAPLPEGMGIWDCDCYPELINELWVMGEQYPDAFPGPGTPSENAVKGVIGEFLGLDIDYYAMVNLDGFVDIVDALGGVNIYVPEQVIDEDYPHEDGTVERIQIDQGWQELDGHLALAYSRTRHQDSDYFRMNRQRCVVEAMIDDADPTSLILNFGKLADVIKNTMLTDIPVDALPELIELLPSVDLDEVVSVRFIPPEYHLKYRDDGKPGRIANIDLVHEHVQLVITDPQRAVEELGLEQLEDVCGDPNA